MDIHENEPLMAEYDYDHEGTFDDDRRGNANSISYEDAIEKTGYGKFHYLVLALCGWAVSSDAVEVLSISFLLPSATCDFNLDSAKKGWLNAIIFIGMMIGGYIWGSLADHYGRRQVLLGSLTVNGLGALASSFCQSFYPFLFMRLISGIGVGGSIPVIFAYFTEFQPKNKRGTMISVLATFWMFGNIIAAGLAWIIVPLEIGYEGDSFSYTSWKIFVAVCTIPSLSSAALFIVFPESPKFLLSMGKEDQALAVLKQIHDVNNSGTGKTFNVKSLILAVNSESSQYKRLVDEDRKTTESFCSRQRTSLKEIVQKKLASVLRRSPAVKHSTTAATTKSTAPPPATTPLSLPTTASQTPPPPPASPTPLPASPTPPPASPTPPPASPTPPTSTSTVTPTTPSTTIAMSPVASSTIFSNSFLPPLYHPVLRPVPSPISTSTFPSLLSPAILRPIPSPQPFLSNPSPSLSSFQSPTIYPQTPSSFLNTALYAHPSLHESTWDTGYCGPVTMATLDRKMDTIMRRMDAMEGTLKEVVQLMKTTREMPRLSAEFQPVTNYHHGSQHIPVTPTFSDISPQYQISGEELNKLHAHAFNAGHFATKLVQRLYPHIFHTPGLKAQYSYFGGGKLGKRELDPDGIKVLKQYVLFYHPELRDPTAWRNIVVSKINELLRRPERRPTNI